MAKIVDPDALRRGIEIVFDLDNKKIQLVPTGNLSDSSPASQSGVTLQAVYSKCKELWKTESDLNKLKFPFDAITPTKMDLVNGWDWKDATTRRLIRDGGWALVDPTTGQHQEEYMSVISLGGRFVDINHKAYYQQVQGFDKTWTFFHYSDELNEPVKIYGDANHGNFDYRNFYKIFLREQGTIYAYGNLLKDQNLPSLDYTVYKLPLVNSLDVKVSDNDLTVETTQPYIGSVVRGPYNDGSVSADSDLFSSESANFSSSDLKKLIIITTGNNAGRYEIIEIINATQVRVNRKFRETQSNITFNIHNKGMTITYIRGKRYETWVSGRDYTVDDVVLDPNNERWYRCKADISNSTTPPNQDTDHWESYPGERQIGSSYYAFNRIINGNNGTLEQIYTFCQWALRQDFNINDDVLNENWGVVKGRIAVYQCSFLGDTLQTYKGAFIDNILPDDRPRIEFYDITVDTGGLDEDYLPKGTTKRTYPFISSGKILFNDNLVNDPDAYFVMYFKSVPAGDYDTPNAVIVKDADGNDIKGLINGRTEVNFTFDYDYNNQGGRTPGTDAPIVIVAIGLQKACWVAAEFTITRAVGLRFPVIAALERNYSNP